MSKERKITEIHIARRKRKRARMARKRIITEIVTVAAIAAMTIWMVSAIDAEIRYNGEHEIPYGSTMDF